MYSGELTDYALKSGNRCERHSRRRASLRFVSLSAYKGRTWKGKRPASTIRGRVTLASTAGGVAGEGVKKKKKEKKKGNIRYTYIVRVYGCCIQFPIAHDAVRRTFFNL